MYIFCALIVAHLAIERHTVVASKEPFFRVHHLSHLQIGAMDVVVQL